MQIEYFRALKRCESYLLVSQGVFEGTYLGSYLFQLKCLIVVFIFHFSSNQCTVFTNWGSFAKGTSCGMMVSLKYFCFIFFSENTFLTRSWSSSDKFGKNTSGETGPSEDDGTSLIFASEVAAELKIQYAPQILISNTTIKKHTNKSFATNFISTLESLNMHIF